jgi:hypothetical protein
MYVCRICKKKFNKEYAVQQHITDAHKIDYHEGYDFQQGFITQKRKKNKEKKIIDDDDDEYDETACPYKYSQGPIWTEYMGDQYDW